jgi:hypothetical protein
LATSPFPPAPSFSPSPAPRSKTKWIVVSSLIVVFLLILLWTCGKGVYRDYRVASAAVELFHHRLDNGDFDTIYSDAGDGFRSFGTKADQIKFLETTHQKLGNSGKTSPLGFHVNWRNRQMFVDQVYSTQFARGTAQESFVWVMENGTARHGTPRLYGYRINPADDLY